MGANVDRRQQYREQTRQEAKRIALEQLASDGVAGISVNAIGKRMGITGPALYRYFANRDALLTELISDGYHDLADTLEGAIASAESRPARLLAAAAAMRAWALAAPHRYMLLFGTPVPGYEAPAQTLDAASRSMAALLSAVGDDPEPPGRGKLHRQTSAWGERMGYGDLTPRQLHWGLAVWSRMHGHLSLEVTDQFTLTQVDPELLFNAEVEALIAWLPPDS
jgi:AcrR family transcriptional regulator